MNLVGVLRTDAHRGAERAGLEESGGWRSGGLEGVAALDFVEDAAESSSERTTASRPRSEVRKTATSE